MSADHALYTLAGERLALDKNRRKLLKQLDRHETDARRTRQLIWVADMDLAEIDKAIAELKARRKDEE